MERELRRNQDLLFCVGSGIITFGFWSLVKGVMSMIFYKDEWAELLTATGTTEEEMAIAIPLLYIIVTVIICLDVLLRLIVGTSARIEGRGRGKRPQKAYLFFGAILGLLSLASLLTDFMHFEENFNTILDGIITVIIDVTSIVMVVELFVAGMKVRRLSKKIDEAKLEEAAA